MPANPSTLSDKDITYMRKTIIDGIQIVMNSVYKLRPACFSSFEDLEIGISTENITSSNCEALNNDELAIFVRIMEKFKEADDKRPPRNIMVGLVIHPPHDDASKADFEVQIWDAFQAKWGGSKEALERGKPNILPEIESVLIRAMDLACETMPYASLDKKAEEGEEGDSDKE